MKYILLLFFIVFLIPNASADMFDDINPISIGAQMITDGINNWVITNIDSCIETGIEITNITGSDVSNQSTINIVFKIATWTYNPYGNEGIIDIIKFTMSIWFVLIIMQILAGITWVNIKDSHPNAAESISFITGINSNSAFNDYMTGLKDNLFITIMSHVVIFLILSLNYVFTCMIMHTMLDVIAPTPDNMMLYFMIGFSYMVMSFFFLIRFLVINIFTAFAPVLGNLYTMNYFTRKIAVKLFTFFCAMVFMQTIIVFITSVGIIGIKGMSPFFAADPTPYIALTILLVITATVIMVGWAFINRSGKTVIKILT